MPDHRQQHEQAERVAQELRLERIELLRQRASTHSPGKINPAAAVHNSPRTVSVARRAQVSRLRRRRRHDIGRSPVLVQVPGLGQRISRNGSPSSRVHMISMTQVLPWFICRSMAFFSAGPTSSSRSTTMPSAPMLRAMSEKLVFSSSPATKRRL
jgi:hypothetical protein